MKILKVKLLLLILSLVIIASLTGLLLPVEFEASACNGGFRSYVVDLYYEEFAEVAHERITNDFTILSTREDVSNTVEWYGRRIECHIEYEVQEENSNSIVQLKYVGTRYWFEKYKWKIADKTINNHEVDT